MGRFGGEMVGITGDGTAVAPKKGVLRGVASTRCRIDSTKRTFFRARIVEVLLDV